MKIKRKNEGGRTGREIYRKRIRNRRGGGWRREGKGESAREIGRRYIGRREGEGGERG